MYLTIIDIRWYTFYHEKNVYVISDVCDKVYSMQMDILVLLQVYS